MTLSIQSGEQARGRATSGVRRRWAPAGDYVLAATCTAVAVAVHLSGVESVSQNRPPDVLSVLLTVAAIAPLAVRRRYPFPVFAACFPAFFALMAGQYPVAMAPLGILVGFYTVAAWGTRADSRKALILLGFAVLATAVLRPVDLSLEGAVVNTLLLAVGFVLGTGARERRALHAAQMAQARHQVDLERERASRAAAEERLRITRDLHDVVGHALSVMVVQAGVAEHLLTSRPEDAAAAVRHIAQSGRASLEEMRRMLTVIGDGDEPASGTGQAQPGLRDLAALAAQVEAAGLRVSLDVALAPDLPSGVQLATYRVVQEALTNTLRHAEARRATVRVDSTDAGLVVEIADDGRGAGPDSAPGRGLSGMRERAAIYGGTLVTDEPPGGGFRVRATIPTLDIAQAPT